MDALETYFCGDGENETCNIEKPFVKNQAVL